MPRKYKVAAYTVTEQSAMNHSQQLVKRAIQDDVPKDVFDEIHALATLVTTACVEARQLRTALLNNRRMTIRKMR